MPKANEDNYPGGGLFLPQLLDAAKRRLQSGVVDGSFATGLNLAEADALMQDAMEVAKLARSLRNSLVRINRMPLEVFSLIPHHLERKGYWERHYAKKHLISMTQVCRRWREILTSHCPSLWTHLDLENPDQTRVYVERSQSLPLKISLHGSREFAFWEGALLETVPHLNRLGSLNLNVPPQALWELSSYLPSPAPILDELKILVDDNEDYAPGDLVIPDTLFPEHPPLCKLILSGVITSLPWRNLSNLTVFEFCHPEGTVDLLFTTQLLDFLTSVPLLRRIVLCGGIPDSFDNPPQRAVSLPNLKKLVIDTIPPNSTFLDHLSIPAGVSLDVALWFSPKVNAKNPVCLTQITDNLQRFTTVNLLAWDSKWKCLRLDGSNGELRVWELEVPLFLPFLEKFDLSETQKLSVTGYRFPRSPDDGSIEDSTIFQTLHTCNLRTLTLNKCENKPFIRALNPRRNQSVLCPNLEELVLYVNSDGPEESLHEDLVEMASERAKSSSKLSSIKIYHGEEDFSLLREYVSYVEDKPISTTLPEWDAAFGDVEDDYNPRWYKCL